MLATMPTELLGEIFKNLDWYSFHFTMRITCHRFNAVIKDLKKTNQGAPRDPDPIFRDTSILHGGALSRDDFFSVDILGKTIRGVKPVNFQLHPIFTALQLRYTTRPYAFQGDYKHRSKQTMWQFYTDNIGIWTHRYGFIPIASTRYATEAATHPATARLYVDATRGKSNIKIGVHGVGKFTHVDRAVTVIDVLEEVFVMQFTKNRWFDVGPRLFKTVEVGGHWHDAAPMNRPSLTLVVDVRPRQVQTGTIKGAKGNKGGGRRNVVTGSKTAVRGICG